MKKLNEVETVYETRLPLPLVGRGKVRDIYAIGEDRLLIVTTDRLSAFDVVLPDPIPFKGQVLTQISVFWFDFLKSVVPNHLLTARLEEMGLPEEVKRKFGSLLEGRSMLVKRARPLPVECVVRGYLTGSGWKDYLKTGSVCGHKLPQGLRQCGKLTKPLFTPATKAVVGHDENIDFKRAAEVIGGIETFRESSLPLVEKVEKLSLALYERGRDYAGSRGILIADTKFEFGLPLTPPNSSPDLSLGYSGGGGKPACRPGPPAGEAGRGEGFLLIDEVLTPDSSRFWPKEGYEPGRDQPSFDKQIVRNYLLELGWNQKPPAPKLPAEIIEKTSQAYREIYTRLTGRNLKE